MSTENTLRNKPATYHTVLKIQNRTYTKMQEHSSGMQNP